MEKLTPATPPLMRTDELIGEISHAIGSGLVSQEAVRACLYRLGELVRDQTAAGRKVDVEWFGSFSRSTSGQVVFDDTEDPWWTAQSRLGLQ